MRKRFEATLEAIKKDHASVYIEQLRFALTDTIDGEGTQMVDYQGYPTFAGPIQQFSYIIRGILKADSSRILPGSRYFEKWTSLHLEQNPDLVPSLTNLRRIVLLDVEWTVDNKNDSEMLMVFIANGKLQPILPHLRTIEWYRAEGTSWSTLRPFMAIQSLKNVYVSNLSLTAGVRDYYLEWPLGSPNHELISLSCWNALKGGVHSSKSWPTVPGHVL